MKNIGIFGGSFDPIHRGHISIADAAIRSGYVDEVWLMVSPENPWKSGRQSTPPEMRVEMARTGVESLAESPYTIKVSDMELSMPRPSYTIDTLRRLQSEYPDFRFRLIVGGDNAANFDKWREADEILDRFGLIIYPRPGEEMIEMPRNSVVLKDVELMPVSSTEIRRLCGEGRYDEASEMLPDGVVDYIKNKRLYRND